MLLSLQWLMNVGATFAPLIAFMTNLTAFVDLTYPNASNCFTFSPSLMDVIPICSREGILGDKIAVASKLQQGCHKKWYEALYKLGELRTLWKYLPLAFMYRYWDPDFYHIILLLSTCSMLKLKPGITKGHKIILLCFCVQHAPTVCKFLSVHNLSIDIFYS